MESDGLGLDLALLHVDLVTAENNGDVLADTDEITCDGLACWELCNILMKRLTVPVGDVLVGDTRGNIEHDDTALAVDVVTITETTELLLTGGIPDIELDLTKVLLFVSCCGLAVVRFAGGRLTVEKPRGWTSTPRVARYFFSNSPVK